MRRVRNGLSAAIFAAATLVASPALAQQGGPPASLVHVDTVKLQAAGRTVPVIGRLVSQEAGVVAARIEGGIERMLIQIGDHVTKGDVVAEIGTDRLFWRKEQMAAELARAEGELNVRKNELRRLANLRKSAAFNQSRYDDIQYEVDVLEANVARAKADLELSEISLRDAEVRAPYSGTVTRKHVAPGAYVRIGDPVISLVNDEALEVEADVPAERVVGLQQGSTVELDIGRLQARGEIRAIVADENPLTRTRAIRIRLVGGTGDRQLTPNESVTVHLPAGRGQNVVTVHKDAIVNRLGETIVFVVEDGKAVLRRVRLGNPVGSYMTVLDGLKPDETVVVRGNERLRPGVPVRIDGGA